MNISIKWRLLATGLMMVFLSCLAISWLGYSKSKSTVDAVTCQAKQALVSRAKAQLESIRSTKAQHIQDYFKTVLDQVRTFSEDRMIIDACQSFRNLFLLVSTSYDLDVIDKMRAELARNFSGEDYLQNPRFDRYRELVPGYHPRSAASYVPEDDNGVVLQYLYILKNPNPVGHKDKLDKAEGDILYNNMHQKYHPSIRKFLETFHYYDIFIIEADTGNILYTVFKEKDFATSLLDGPYKDTNLARCFRQARAAGKRGEKDFVAVADFAPYEPSYNAPAAFVASPIFDGDEFIGVLAFQVSIDEINRIMLCDRKWEEIGLGRTGETYLVGQDYKMRSSSRFQTDALMKLSVHTPAVEKALNGQTGAGIIKNYQGQKVLSAWQPLSISGLNYVLVAEIGVQEALAGVKKMQNFVASAQDDLLKSNLFTLGIVLLLACGVFWVVVLLIVNPLTRVAEYARVVSSGQFDAALDGRFPGELGVLKQAIVTMVGRLKKRIAEAQQLSIKSKEEAEKARQAMQQAEEARKQAEMARREGLHEAARRLEKVINTLVSSVEQLSVQSDQVEKGTQVQKQSSEETATAMEQMSSSVMEVAKNASAAAEKTEEARTKAETGASVVSEAAKAIEMINELTEQLKKKMGGLKEKAGGISQIMNVISDIADQTNLLALNAAIEAARAGEAGRGFAVVADEVRKLAEKTMVATKEVGQAISEIQSEVEMNVGEMNRVAGSVQKGTELAEESHRSLQEIVELVVNVADQVRAIATASEEQSAVSEEISRSVENIKNISEETAKGMKETKQAIESLVRLAEELQDLTEELGKA